MLCQLSRLSVVDLRLKIFRQNDFDRPAKPFHILAAEAFCTSLQAE